MDLTVEALFELIKSGVTAILAALFGGWMVAKQARRSFEMREFLDRINFSLNILQGGHLLIRTLLEKPVTEVFQNAVTAKMVKEAASHTTEEDCLLPITNKEDSYWLCLNNLLNVVSEKYSVGFLKQDLNYPVSPAAYVMCLTCEVSQKMRTRKIRAMLIKKSVLLQFPESDPAVTAGTHTTRIKTLRQLARDYQNEAKKHCFIEIELCI